jgi:hypothetical protein
MLRIVLKAAAVAIVCTGALAQMTPFCRPGIDSGVICPCANPPVGGGLGCNKFGIGPLPSSVLTAIGSPIVGPGDSIVLEATGMNNLATYIFFQSKNSIGPVVYGAGIRCIGGSLLKRLYMGNAVGGAALGRARAIWTSHPLGDVPGPIDIISMNSTRYYMTYRDPAAAVPAGTLRPRSTARTRDHTLELRNAGKASDASSCGRYGLHCRRPGPPPETASPPSASCTPSEACRPCGIDFTVKPARGIRRGVIRRRHPHLVTYAPSQEDRDRHLRTARGSHRTSRDRTTGWEFLGSTLDPRPSRAPYMA